MNKEEDCPFCNLGDRVIDQNNSANVFLSNPRLVPYHLLITPKRHVEKPYQLTLSEQQAIFKLILKWQKFIVDHVAGGCDVRENYRPFIKQGRVKINHIHYHLLPRELGDEIFVKSQIFEAEIFREVTKTELDPRQLL